MATVIVIIIIIDERGAFVVTVNLFTVSAVILTKSIHKYPNITTTTFSASIND